MPLKSSKVPFYSRLYLFWVGSITTVFHQQGYRWFAAAIFSLLLIMYLILLPASAIGADIGWRSFQHLDLKIILFSFSLALLESLLISMWVYLSRNKNSCSTGSATGGILVGLFAPLLCCTPMLAILFSSIAIIFPTAVSGLGLQVQYTINVYQTEFLLFALCLLVLATYQNAKHIVDNHIARSLSMSH